ncbi:MAG: VOC family protein [Ilumatobacteraceae bacterium]
MNAFEQLRHTATGEPIAPDAAFAARLRARVAEALRPSAADVPVIDLPERSTAMTTIEPATEASSAPTAPAAVVPYLCCRDAAAAIDWYGEVFGAVETIRYLADDGRVGHAEVTIGGARLMLSDEYPEIDVVSPTTLGGTPFSLNLDVADVDAVWAAAIDHGASGERPPADQPYGARSCTFRDPSGHRWSVQTRIGAPTPQEIEEAMEGYTLIEPAPAPAQAATAPVELGYFTLGFDDTAMATRFYRELFGWQTEQGHAGGDYAHVHNTDLPLGFTPDGIDTAPVLYFRVDDAAAYATRVRELGGTVVSETTYESGGSIVCRDDQGREFQLWQPAPGY